VAPSNAARPPFLASGFGGQFIWVDVALELVIAASSEVSQDGNARAQALDLIRQRIVPAVAGSLAEQPCARGG
jgi:hypothetical protein